MTDVSEARRSTQGIRLSGPLLVLALILGAVYLLGVANLTLFHQNGVAPRNFVPFRTISSYFSDPGYSGQVRARNLGGNLVMLLPLGLLLACATTLTRARALLWIMGVSIGIEAWQLLSRSGRSVDIDDVILNTAGGALGCTVGLLLLRVAASAQATNVVKTDNGPATVR